MFVKSFFRLDKCLSLISTLLLSFLNNSYAKENDFHSRCFDMTLDNNLSLISKTEEESSGFYRYIFSSSNNDAAELQIRVIVSNKKPKTGQSLEDFQLTSIGAMSAMFINSYGLYDYLNTPENKKVLNEKPYELEIDDATFAGTTMYFGKIDASFLVTRTHNMTYAFTLISKNNNKQIRKNNLKLLTEELESIRFQSCSE